MAWKDSVLYSFSIQVVNHHLQIHYEHLDGRYIGTMSAATFRKMWYDCQLNKVKSLCDSDADKVGIPRGEINPGWKPDEPPPPEYITLTSPQREWLIYWVGQGLMAESQRNTILTVEAAGELDWLTLEDKTNGRADELLAKYLPPPAPPEPEPEELPGFWERIKDTWIAELVGLGFELKEELITRLNQIYKLITGFDFDEATATEWAKWVTGMNTVSILLNKEELDGTPKDEPSSADWLDLALTAMTLPMAPATGLVKGTIKLLPVPKVVKLLEYIPQTVGKQGITLAEVAKRQEMVAESLGKIFFDKLKTYPDLMIPEMRALSDDALKTLTTTLGKTEDGIKALNTFIPDTGYEQTAKIVKNVLSTPAFKTATPAVKQFGESVGKQVFGKAGKLKLWANLPKTWKWWIGILAGTASFGFISSWLGKESVWEAATYPLTDALRDEDWETAKAVYPRLEPALDFYKSIVNTVGWLNPISAIIFRRGFEEAEANIKVWGDIIERKGALDTMLDISSFPQEAKIYVDGTYIWESTNTFLLIEPGTHEITLKLDGYHDDIFSVTIAAGETVVESRILTKVEEEPDKALPEVVCSSTPTGAKIYVDGEYIWEQTKTLIRVQPGFRLISFKMEGYEDANWSGDLSRGDTLGLPMTLKLIEEVPPDLLTTITLSSVPKEAKIYVDFENIWETTNTTIKVAPGARTITLKRDGFEEDEFTVTIAEGEKLDYHRVLKEIVTVVPPGVPGEPEVPGEVVEIPLEPTEIKYNAWKVTIKAVDEVTGEELRAAILINDEYMARKTPAYFYLQAESAYNIKLRLKGYYQGELDYTTKALPIE